MTDHFSRLMVRGACSIKIGMDKNYLNILEVRVSQPVGRRDLESPETFLPPHQWYQRYLT